MNDNESTVLATLLVTHRSVPMGRTSLVEVWPDDPDAKQSSLWLLGFEPLSEYETIRPIVVRATVARAKLWFLGPVEDPESDRRGREAKDAYEVLMSQLEVYDDEGRFVPVDNLQLWEGQHGGKPDFFFMGIIDDAMATVVARLNSPPRGHSDHEPPAA